LDCMPLAALALFLLLTSERYVFAARISCVYLMVAYAGFRLVPCLLHRVTRTRQSLIERLVLTSFITQEFLACTIAASVYLQDHDVSNAVLFFCFISWQFNPGLRIWRKLRKTEVFRDLPPTVVS
jgi:hypothetical protein